MSKAFWVILFHAILTASLCGQIVWVSPIGPVSALAINSQNYIFAAAKGAGILRSTNYGETWSQVNGALQGYFIPALVAGEDSSIYTATSNGLYKSSDYGATWSMISTGFNSQDVRSVAYIPSTKTILAGVWEDYVYRSTNGGSSWDKITAGIDYDKSDVISFCVDSSQRVFAGTNGNVYRSTDDGINWSKVADNITPNYVLSLAVAIDSTIFAGTNDRGVYRSPDHGQTWEKINAGFDTTAAVNALCARGNRVFAATNPSGIFIWSRGEDTLWSWTMVDSGLTAKNFYSLSISGDGYLFTGSIGFSIFRTKDTVLSVKEMPGSNPVGFFLFQNYPNPFNPTTNITYELPERSNVEISIFNSLGQRVRTLFEGQVYAGIHTVIWDSRNDQGKLVSSGSYFYQVNAGKSYQTKKAILLK